MATAALVLVLGEGSGASAQPATTAATIGYLADSQHLYTLNTGTLGTTTVGNLDGNVEAIGVGGDGRLYGIAGASFKQQVLEVIDRSTAGTTQVAPATGLLATQDDNEFFSGVAGTPDGVTYLASHGFYNSLVRGRLYTVDLGTGAVTQVGTTVAGDGLQSLTSGCGGRLLGLDTNGHLVDVDGASNTYSNPRSISGPDLGPNDSVYAIGYDHAARKLYALTWDSSVEKVFLMDPSTGNVTATAFASDLTGNYPSMTFDAATKCRYSRALTIGYSKSQAKFHGALKSSHASCVSDMPVNVYRKRTGADELIGTRHTTSAGSYAVPASVNRGTYYAVAPQRSSGDAVCLAAKSTSLTL